MGAPSDLAKRLSDYGNIGTMAAPSPTIFIGLFPSSPDQCVAVRGTGGLTGVYTMGRNVGAIVTEHAVQVLTRALTYVDAEALAWRAYAALDNWEGTLNGNTYLRIVARHPPFSLGHDENQRTVFTGNYIAQRRER